MSFANTTTITRHPHPIPIIATAVSCGWWTTIWARTSPSVYPLSNTPRSLRSENSSHQQVSREVDVGVGVAYPPVIAPQQMCTLHTTLALTPQHHSFISSPGMLNGHYVGCVRVSFLDTSTLAGRSGYFDSVGITRDILQVGVNLPLPY